MKRRWWRYDRPLVMTETTRLRSTVAICRVACGPHRSLGAFGMPVSFWVLLAIGVITAFVAVLLTDLSGGWS
jgi:hypothetical protein